MPLILANNPRRPGMVPSYVMKKAVAIVVATATRCVPRRLLPALDGLLGDVAQIIRGLVGRPPHLIRLPFSASARGKPRLPDVATSASFRGGPGLTSDARRGERTNLRRPGEGVLEREE